MKNKLRNRLRNGISRCLRNQNFHQRVIPDKRLDFLVAQAKALIEQSKYDKEHEDE
jgi:hypothetical protein